MTDGSDDIIETVKKLRAEAVERLQGNDYFAVANKLDALLVAGELDSQTSQDLLAQIHAGLGHEKMADVESSAHEQNTPTETEEEKVISSPKANSFGTPQPTVAVGLAQEEDGEQKASEEPVETQSSPAETEEENTGFNALSQASWRRVQQVTEASEAAAVPLINGNAAGDHDLASAQAVAADTQAERFAAQAVETVSEVAEPEVAPAEAAPIAETAADEQEAAPEPQPTMTEAETTRPEVEDTAALAPQDDVEPAYETAFRVLPQPLIINRPVKTAQGPRLKRKAKLAHLPKKRS